MSLFEVGTEVIKAGNPKDKSAIAEALSQFKVTTSVGAVEWGKFPIPSISPVPLLATQWVKATADQVIVDNVNDPDIPVGAKLQPYS